MMNETPRRSRRLVLKDHVGVADVNAFADARDWTVLGTVERDPEKGFFFEKKWAARAGVSMHYIVDEFLGERYMMAMSRHGNPDRELTRLSAGLDTWSLDEALFQFDASVYGADKERAVRLLAAISPLRRTSRSLSVSSRRPEAATRAFGLPRSGPWHTRTGRNTGKHWRPSPFAIRKRRFVGTRSRSWKTGKGVFRRSPPLPLETALVNGRRPIPI
ncbi:hypothetical protein ACFQHO_39875 [Actinomadura yumaensis]|uniref:hypothetical protein n=1 Tax=Actinomadura yumaensis TaxID=111807 RepID=UPI0036082228